MTRFRGTRSIVAVTGVLLLAACAAPEPAAPGPTEVPSSTPSAEPTESAVVGAPSPVLPLDCATFLPDALVASSVSSALEPMHFSAAGSYSAPTFFAARQLGGWACASNNGESTSHGIENAGYSGIRLQILPAATAQFETYAEMYPDVSQGADSQYGEASNVTCFGRGAESLCTANILVNDFWVDLSLSGIDVDASVDDAGVAAQVAPLLDHVVGVLAPASPTASAWAPDADTIVLPEGCEALIAPEEWGTVTGRGAEASVFDVSTARGGWGLPAAAGSEAKVSRCAIYTDDFERPFGVLQALPGGAWAFDEASELQLANGQATESAPLAGVDKAFFGCQSEAGSTCWIDGSIGGNWFRLELWEVDSADPAQVESQLRELLTATVARVNA